jgi:hypothetical protein
VSSETDRERSLLDEVADKVQQFAETYKEAEGKIGAVRKSPQLEEALAVFLSAEFPSNRVLRNQIINGIDTHIVIENKGLGVSIEILRVADRQEVKAAIDTGIDQTFRLIDKEETSDALLFVHTPTESKYKTISVLGSSTEIRVVAGGSFL